MLRGWSNIDIERKQSWAATCWLNLAHASSFTGVQKNQLVELIVELDCELKDTSEAFKHDLTTTVKPLHRNGKEYVLKRYNARSRWHRVKRALRMSRAQRCWRMSLHFQRANLNVAEPILMLESRSGPITKNAYFVSTLLHGKELLTQLPAMDITEQKLVRQAIEIAFSDMRKHKISHGDLKASNLLWVNQQLFFIDLDAARKHRFFLTWQLANLKDRKRFLKNWQNHSELLTLFSELT